MGICLILPIYRFGEIIEFFIVGNCSELPHSLFYAALKTAISILSIEYEMRQSVFTVVNRSRNGLMDAITNSGRLTPSTISEWAGLLGFKSKRLYIVIYLDFIPAERQKDMEFSAYYAVLEFMIHYYHPDDYYFLRALSNGLYMVGQFPPESSEQAQKKSKSHLSANWTLFKNEKPYQTDVLRYWNYGTKLHRYQQKLPNGFKSLKKSLTPQENPSYPMKLWYF